MKKKDESTGPGSAEASGGNEKSNTEKKKIDRYGYIVTDQTNISKEEENLRNKEAKKEAEREMKWAIMLSKWDTFDKSKINQRIKKGIPDCVRGIAWRRILDPESFNDEKFNSRMSLDQIIEEGEVPCCRTIEVDLERTMPTSDFFKQKAKLDALRKVLHAYSNFDKELGYTQGMGFYVGLLLSYMDEKESFWCFKNIMMDKWNMRFLFLKDFPHLHKLRKPWEHLFNSKHSQVLNRLNKLGISYELYSVSWFLCSFMNTSFNPELKLRIFDRIIAFGTRAKFSFAITIISLLKKKLLKLPMERVLFALQNPDAMEEFQDWRNVIVCFDKHWLSRKQYQSLFSKTNTEFIK